MPSTMPYQPTSPQFSAETNRGETRHDADFAWNRVWEQEGYVVDEVGRGVGPRRAPGSARMSPAPFAVRADEAPRASARAGRGEALSALRADPRRAIQEDVIRCLECGRALRQLTNTHLRSHGITARDYKRRFGYNRGRPLMCLTLQRLYVERAVKSGLAAQIRCRPILAQPELRRRG